MRKYFHKYKLMQQLYFEIVYSAGLRHCSKWVKTPVALVRSISD